MLLRAERARLRLAFDKRLLRLAQALLGLKTFRNHNRDSVRHLVVFRVGNIGDIVVAMPALMRLRERFPEAMITLVTSCGKPGLPGAAEVLSPFAGLVDRIVPYDSAAIKKKSGLRDLKNKILETGKVDLFVDLPITVQTLRRGLQELYLARLLASRRVMGFDLLLPASGRSIYAKTCPHEIRQTSAWLLSLVTDGKVESVPEFQGAFEDCDGQGRNLDASRPLLAVNAGAKLAIKRWPENYFTEALAEYLKRHPKTQVALLGNAEEAALNERIRCGVLSRTPDACVINLSGRLTLSGSWHVLRQATLVLSNDTGTMHMAGLLDKSLVTPMSGQFPAPLWHPYYPGNDATQKFIPLRQAVPCAPCFYESCPLAEQTCLTGIPPQQVVEALESLTPAAVETSATATLLRQ